MRGASLLFGRLGVFSFRHAWAILAIGLMLCLGLAVFLKDLRFDSVSTILSVDDPEMDANARSLEMFGDSGALIIRMEPGGAPLSSLDGWTEAVIAELRSWEDIRYVESSPVDFSDVPAAAAFVRAAVLNSGQSALEALAGRFEEGGMERELRSHRKLLLAAPGAGLPAGLASDPLNLREVLAPHLETARGNMTLAGSGAYLDAENGRSRILLVHPEGLSEDINFSQHLVARIKTMMEETRISSPAPPGAGFGLTGKFAQSAEASRIVVEDMRILSLAASLLIFLLIWSVFRRTRAVFIAFIPLALSLAASFWLALLFFNPLSLIAMAFAAIILGLGVDIVLHCTGRVFQLFPESGSLEEAVRLTMEDCGPPVAIGVTTTASAFFCLFFARFEALSQFGLLASGSLMITLAVTLVAFPAAVRLLFPVNSARLYPRFQDIPAKIFSFSARRPIIALAAGLIILGLSLPAAREFRFEMDLFKGLPDSMPSLAAADEIAHDFGTSLVINSQVFIEGPSLNEAMAAQQEIDRKLEELAREEKIAGFQSPSLFLPYPESLHQNRADLARLGSLIRERREDFFSLLAKLKIRSSSQSETYYDVLEEAFPPGGIPSLDALAIHPDPRLERHLNRADGVILQTYVWPAGNDRDLQEAWDVSTEFSGFSPSGASLVRVTGALQFYEKLNSMLRSEFFRVSLISLASILLLSSVFFRHLPTILLSLVPLLGAIPFTFAALALFGLSFTPAGIGITAMVLGIGIDDSVHILVRMRNRPLSHLSKVIREIGPILFLTTISTMLGFGALLLSRLYSIRSMGLAVALGVFACLFYTILFIPSLLKLITRKRITPPKHQLIMLLAIASVNGPGSAGPAVQQSKLDRILESLEDTFNTTEAFSHDFEQTRYLRQLTEPMTFTGTMVFRKPHFLRMEMRGEENMNIYVNGEHVWLEDLDFGEVEQFDFAEAGSESSLAGILPPLFLNGIGEIKERFQVRLDEAMGQDVIAMVPRKGYESPFTSIRFAVGSFSRILWMRIDYANGNWTHTRFSGWKNLPEISEHYFRYRGEN